MKILLSIHKKYSTKILNGTKRFELRRRFTNKNVKTIYIYETSPTKMVVGKTKVIKIHKLPIKDLWTLTSKANGVSKMEFFQYYKGLRQGIAIEVEAPTKFSFPKPLSIFNLSRPPQSFQFIRK